LPAFWPGGLRPPVVLDPRTAPGGPRGSPFFTRRGGGKEGKRERERGFFFRFKESFTVLLHRLEGKRRREKKRTSRLLLPLFRGTPDLLVDLEEIASFRMRE
jgi:hypothetical protein